MHVIIYFAMISYLIFTSYIHEMLVTGLGSLTLYIVVEYYIVHKLLILRNWYMKGICLPGKNKPRIKDTPNKRHFAENHITIFSKNSLFKIDI